MVNALAGAVNASATGWPQPGQCGACARGAHRYPSGRWAHDGRPCRARYQTLWPINDVDIRCAAVFVAAGEPLPTAPDKTMIDTDPEVTVREWLARDAENRTNP